MWTATKLSKEWAKLHSKYRFPTHWTINKNRLTLKSGKFVHYVGKGWHIFVLMEWLEAFLADKNIDPDIRMIAWSGNFLMGSLHIWRDSSTLLEDWQQRELHTVGEFHLRKLLALHEKYKGFCAYGLFNIRPKFHMLAHIFDTSKVRSPIVGACWMDEDWVRSVAHLARKTHAKKTHHSTLMRYSAGTGFVSHNKMGIECLPWQDSNTSLKIWQWLEPQF